MCGRYLPSVTSTISMTPTSSTTFKPSTVPTILKPTTGSDGGGDHTKPSRMAFHCRTNRPFFAGPQAEIASLGGRVVDEAPNGRW
jgi:hypothetical protein